MCVTPSACLLLLQCSKCAPDRLNQAIESGAEEKEAKLQEDRERREDLCKQLKGLFKAIDQDGSGTLTLDELLAGDLNIRNTLAEVPFGLHNCLTGPIQSSINRSCTLVSLRIL